MNWAGIPINEYRKFAYPESGDKQFTADRFNASEWAQLAKDAGMKYMNLTAMHHDGFALFESSYPNSFTSKQTLGRDLVKEYVEACRKAGLKVGIYKTLINWRYPGYYDIDGTGKSPFFKGNTKWGYKAETSHKENARIMKDELYHQTKELMTKYGKIDQVFWDGGWLGERGTDADAAFFWEPGKYRDPNNAWPVAAASGDVEQATGKPLGLMGMVRKYQPDILVNPRTGWYGDYLSEEGASPITGPVRSTQLYEKTLSMHESWGYDTTAEDPDKVISADKVKRILSDCIIRNMVLLLNVGPDRHGTITKAEGIVTIANDDALPTLSIGDVSIVEGNNGTADAVQQVTLSAPSGQNVSVKWQTADGTASAPTDYLASSGVLTFAPGVTKQTLTNKISGDILVEGDESFTVNLSAAVNASTCQSGETVRSCALTNCP